MAQWTPSLKGRVLLAEDNSVVQLAVGFLLSEAGVEVVFVDNGQSAIEELRQSTFDLVLMDMRMPFLNGSEVTRQLRKEGKMLPIIALTAATERSDIEECYQAGCTSFLGKDFSREEFFSKLSRFLPRADHTTAQIGSQSEISSSHRSSSAIDGEFHAIADEFVADLNQQLYQLECAWSQNDMAKLFTLSHQLRGAAVLFKLHAIAHICEELEALSQGRHEDQRIEILLKEFGKVIMNMHKY